MSKQCATCSIDTDDDDAKSCVACGGLFASTDAPLPDRHALWTWRHPFRAALISAVLLVARAWRRRY